MIVQITDSHLNTRKDGESARDGDALRAAFSHVAPIHRAEVS